MGRILSNESFQRCVRVRSFGNDYVAPDMWMYDAELNTEWNFRAELIPEAASTTNKRSSRGREWRVFS